jgi:hypothetical protein
MTAGTSNPSQRQASRQSNLDVQPTAYSVRPFVAPAYSGCWHLVLDFQIEETSDNVLYIHHLERMLSPMLRACE